MSQRLAVTGVTGQVVSALIERAPWDVEIIALGRPQLDLGVRNAVLALLRHAGCDAIVNAAAYTQVDKAENAPERAMRVNGDGAGNIADAAAELGAPLLHLSTDYVFDGSLDRPYREDDPNSPLTAYGRSKLAGEEQIAARHQNHLILRTARVYSRFGVNFVKTMLRLGAQRDEVGVVADQWGNPTNALDIAGPTPNLRGVFHLAGAGEATWADVAEETFAIAERLGRKPVRLRLRRITTADHPTPAREFPPRRRQGLREFRPVAAALARLARKLRCPSGFVSTIGSVHARNHSRRRQRHAASSHDARHLKAAAPGL